MDFQSNSIAEGSVQKFLHVPYNERWEYLKPSIIRIYIEEHHRLKELAARMKEEYSFEAQVHQYRYRLKQWGIQKRTTTEQKNAITTALGKRRARDGVSSSDVVIAQGEFGKPVDKKQLKRFLNDAIRHDLSVSLRPGLFLRHNLPYSALMQSNRSQVHQHTSPFGASPQTPDYLAINSPQSAVSSPAQVEGLSPTMQLVQRKELLDRAGLLLQGREQELMARLNKSERRIIATWLHDFWLYSFITTKYWGRGPRAWNSRLIDFKTSAGLPLLRASDNDNESMSSPTVEGPSTTSVNVPVPSQLCRWSIHYKSDIKYEKIPSPPQSEGAQSEEQFDIDDDSTWRNWPTRDGGENLVSTIGQGLQSNCFSAAQPDELPLAADAVVKLVDKSPEDLAVEAWGFAIMSRNLESLDWDNIPESIDSIHPFHLAASFLDGAHNCCLVMSELVRGLQESSSIGINYTNEDGHTVLDSLFLTILRSHSSTTPQAVSDSFRNCSRFPGEEVDPCGRWDADSPCIRHLYAEGNATVPSTWRHMFCHTSVQAICHSIAAIFMLPWRPNINTSSGLFLKRCVRCDRELKLGPLHALVLVAFFLAKNSMPGETLFGMIACLVCVLTLGADPRATAEVSVPLLFHQELADECQHSSVTPVELALRISSESITDWPPQVQVGWKALIHILKFDIAHREYLREEDTEPDEDDDDYCFYARSHPVEHGIMYCDNKQLGCLWAATQAELLTYRRINEGDPWMSSQFDMSAILNMPSGEEEEWMNRLTGGRKLAEFSRCGYFQGSSRPGCARREEACLSYYANLDDWQRTSFIVERRDMRTPLNRWVRDEYS